MKAQITITGKRAKLGSEKAKKQSVISTAFARHKNESYRKHAQWAGVLWTDEDFEFCKLDHHCSGLLIEELVVEPARVFHCYHEDWEDVQFGLKGDDAHAARVSAKYGGLMFYDADFCGDDMGKKYWKHKIRTHNYDIIFGSHPLNGCQKL